MGREEPFSGSGSDRNLVNPLLAWNKDLDVDAAIGGFLFSFLDLFPGEVPVGKKSVGIAGGKEEAAGSVGFGQVSQKFKCRRKGGGFLREERGEGEGVVGGRDWQGDFSQTGAGRFVFRPRRGAFFGAGSCGFLAGSGLGG